MKYKPLVHGYFCKDGPRLGLKWEDNCHAWMNNDSSHEVMNVKPQVEMHRFSNASAVMLVWNTTSDVQPMDGGVTHSAKARYKQRPCEELFRQCYAVFKSLE